MSFAKYLEKKAEENFLIKVAEVEQTYADEQEMLDLIAEHYTDLAGTDEAQNMSKTELLARAESDVREALESEVAEVEKQASLFAELLSDSLAEEGLTQEVFVKTASEASEEELEQLDAYIQERAEQLLAELTAEAE